MPFLIPIAWVALGGTGGWLASNGTSNLKKIALLGVVGVAIWKAPEIMKAIKK